MTDMRGEATKTVALRLETELDAPVATVWRALADPAILARWLLPVIGGEAAAERFALEGDAALGGRIDCAVLASDPPRQLSLLWRLPAGDDGVARETVVTFTLSPLPEDRSRLELVHDGFVVPADYPVDHVAEEGVVVLLPLDAIARRRVRRRPAHIRLAAWPTVMRLAA